MKKILIKICGIRDPQMAIQAAQLGADFIGIIFHPPSVRYVDIDQAVEIAAAAKNAGIEPVAVFVDTFAPAMLEICKTTGIQFVQLHGKISRQQHHLLPVDFHRIYVRTVTEHGIVNADEEGGQAYLDTARDFLLFDNIQAGYGKTFDRSHFHYAGAFRWFLAGGLSVQNVRESIQQLHPDGVDVSSGVEITRGQKDVKLVKEFIAEVKSVSLKQ